MCERERVCVFVCLALMMMMVVASDPKPQDKSVMPLILTGNYPIIADIVLTTLYWIDSGGRG